MTADLLKMPTIAYGVLNRPRTIKIQGAPLKDNETEFLVDAVSPSKQFKRSPVLTRSKSGNRTSLSPDRIRVMTRSATKEDKDFEGTLTN